MYDFLRYGIIVSFLISFASLSYLLILTLLCDKKTLFAKSQGKAAKGILYALTLGLAPWEKESAVKHLPTYLSGILYHAGIFFGIAYTMIVVIGISISREIMLVMQILLAGGIFSGSGLFLKRLVIPYMREISFPDDFISNILVDSFMFFALLDTFFLKIRPFFLIIAILLFLYIPLGKIRHCFFFFFSRVLFGRYFGKRGVLPHGQKQTMDEQ